MNKLLAYGLWILLSLSSVSAIWCHDCEKKSVREKCPKMERARCWAGKRESCYRQNLYYGTTLLFLRYGCFKSCREIYKPSAFLWFTFTCCDENYCNNK